MFSAMEYIASGDLLSNMEADETPIPRAAVTHICAEVILGINFLHKNQIIYRDLKQENILVLPGEILVFFRSDYSFQMGTLK